MGERSKSFSLPSSKFIFRFESMESIKTKLLLLLLATVFGCADLDRYPDGESVFHATFNSLPLQDVTELQGDGHAFRDNSTNYLRFNAPPATVQRLVGKTFGPPISAATFNTGISGQTPAWWRPTANSTTKFYSSTGFHPTLSSGDAYYSYDSNAQLVHLYWNGWD